MLYETRLAYYEDPYQTALETEVLRVDESENGVVIYLDATLFYPAGGGQPADQGSITTAGGRAEVYNAQIKDGVVRHECKLAEGQIAEGEAASLGLDWERRFRNMRVHSAGHIIHDVLMGRVEGLTPTRGDHGSKAYIEYRAASEVEVDVDALEAAVNGVIAEGRAVTCRETSLEELREIAQFVPPNLPTGKPLRVMQIEGYPAMPDGGTQVRDVKEIGRVEITAANSGPDKLTVKYRVHDAE